MINPTIHKKDSYHYAFFDSVKDFNDFTDRQSKTLKRSNAKVWSQKQILAKKRIAQNSDWYGSQTPKHITDLEDHRNFLGMQLLDKIRPRIQKYLHPYLQKLSDTTLPKPKVAYNDRALGIFSFDRAAMGLYRFLPRVSGEPLTDTATQLKMELDTGNKATTVKKVYAYFEHHTSSYPALNLYLSAGGNKNIAGDQLLYVGLAASELINFMQQRNIPTQIHLLLGSSYKKKTVLAVIKVKRFEDSLDTNQLLLTSSDPRYFRYRGFKGIICLNDYFGFTIPANLGVISQNMGRDFVNVIDPKAIAFEQSYSMDAAAHEVVKIIQSYQKKLKS